jgi:queuine/archaeosine tRNA-ribosyltransferase
MPGKTKTKILIITSCTGDKAVKHDNRLTMGDLRQGAEHLKKREAELADLMMPAEELYTGMQHVRLMRGVNALRENKDFQVELQILSAGYGLVEDLRRLAPYDATFNGMKMKELVEWAEFLNVPKEIRSIISRCFDLILVLLGDGYLRACQLDDDVDLGGPAVFFTGKASASRLPDLAQLQAVILGNPDTRKFACGLVGLKGEVAARLLEHLASGDLTVAQIVENPETIIAGLATPTALKTKPASARANPNVDKVISIPQSWWDKPHRAKLRYFIPEWDDLVDPDYDFETDAHSGGRGDWSNEVYAHQMYTEPNYDGILMSRAVAEKSKKKNARINEMGVHRFLRVPRNFPIMGDCGAFDYIDKEEPPYTTEDVIDYYTRLDFDFGVSVDHLVVPAYEQQKQFRYDLTVHNAEDFLNEHRKGGLAWEPIGAVQGWDPNSYAAAVEKYQKMGYQTIALGGLVRSTTKNLLAILEQIKPVLKPSTRMHLFGIARPEAIAAFADLGVTSIDSASHLRRAWLVARDNYFTLDGNSFSAIRIPDVDKSFRAKRIVKEGRATFEEIQVLERNCRRVVREFDVGQLGIEATLDVLDEYDQLISEGRKGMRAEYQRTLEATPWRECGCNICKRWGVQVMIFRGNNRNRRRGFHNTYVFYRLMQDSLLGKEKPQDTHAQLGLFGKAATG